MSPIRVSEKSRYPANWPEKRGSAAGRRRRDRDREKVVVAAREVCGNRKWVVGLDELRAALAALGGEDG